MLLLVIQLELIFATSQTFTRVAFNLHSKRNSFVRNKAGMKPLVALDSSMRYSSFVRHRAQLSLCILYIFVLCQLLIVKSKFKSLSI